MLEFLRKVSSLPKGEDIRYDFDLKVKSEREKFLNSLGLISKYQIRGRLSALVIALVDSHLITRFRHGHQKGFPRNKSEQVLRQVEFLAAEEISGQVFDVVEAIGQEIGNRQKAEELRSFLSGNLQRGLQYFEGLNLKKKDMRYHQWFLVKREVCGELEASEVFGSVLTFYKERSEGVL